MNNQSKYKTIQFQDYPSHPEEAEHVPSYANTPSQYQQLPLSHSAIEPQQYDTLPQQGNQENTANHNVSKTPQSGKPKVRIVIKSYPRNVTQNRQREQNKTPISKARDTGYLQNLTKQKTLQNFRESLYFDERINKVPKSTVQNQIIDGIVREADMLLAKKPLLDSIYKLKQLDLLRNKDFAVNKMAGIGKSSFVYNDYHTKSTNNGYSRNFGGVFYTR